MEQTNTSPTNCVKDLLTERLRLAGHSDPAAWEAGLHPEACDANVDQRMQRFHVNRRLRTVIGKFAENTLAVRIALVDDGDTEDWLRHLDKAVIPCILRNDQAKTSTASAETIPA